MTYLPNSGAAAPNKPYIHLPTIPPVAMASGLVQHALVRPTDQIVILTCIDETGSASVRDVMAVLEGHNDPAGAIEALIAAEVIKADIRNGVMDQHTVLTRSAPGGGSSTPDDSLSPTVPLPHGVVALSTGHLQPSVLVTPGAERGSLRRLGALQRPGVYVLLSDNRCYVGASAAVGRRVAAGSQLEDVDSIITITDKHGGLSEDDALVLERIMHARVATAREVALVNNLPDGAQVTPERYAELDLFAARACHALASTGHLFVHLCARTVLAGPRAEQGRMAPLRRFEEIPDGRLVELTFGDGHMALACHRADGDWVLLRGSDVRLDTVASAPASVSYLRAAWLHAGILELSHDRKSYMLTRDVKFRSASGALHFVVGAKGAGRGGWQPIEPEPQAVPRPAA